MKNMMNAKTVTILQKYKLTTYKMQDGKAQCQCAKKCQRVTCKHVNK